MAEQKGKGGGARKYGQNRRQPAKMRYTTKRKDENKIRKMEKQIKLMASNRPKLGDSIDKRKNSAPTKQPTKQTFPGWEYRQGYGWIRV